VETRIVARGRSRPRPTRASCGSAGQACSRAITTRRGDDKGVRPRSNGGAAWFRTGDTVTRDPFAQRRALPDPRSDEASISQERGYKLSALEIEEVLRDHPGVAEVAVVGVADEAWGERVVACVVRRGEKTCDGGALRAFCRERLAAYKVPKDMIFLEELPKTLWAKS